MASCLEGLSALFPIAMGVVLVLAKVHKVATVGDGTEDDNSDRGGLLGMSLLLRQT